ncbi:serine/threonine-protein kinase OXI1-like [Prosopis cineraria]|uniref:serine/threonine-protein kinase OXI1-like n=1 Tax=Prosopis cineraria TaxID=364024 RepID=UPI002410421D|nr:serine/threonine-protein kinase OXI1-like [Prosopis cineraria]
MSAMNIGDVSRLRHRTFPELDFQDMKVISAVGRGAKGVVFAAKRNDDAFGEYFALKVISKALIKKKAKAMSSNDEGECKRVSFEQQVLRHFDHPLLPRLRGVVETEKIIGYAIDYCPGGNLHSLRKKQTEKMFSDDTIRFYAVELVLALEYLHNLGIVYRDLKPENVLIQETGHIMLVDFDLSKKLNPKSPESQSIASSPISHSSKTKTMKDLRKKRFFRFYSCSMPSPRSYEPEVSQEFQCAPRSESDSVEKSNSFVGTEEYVAPEVVSGKGHDFGVDWWSLGVVLYEMLYGTTPFRGENRKETFYRILTKEPELTGEKTPLRDLIGKLLEKDRDRRIDVEGIKGHDFFKGVQWDSVLQMARPPYIPLNDVGDTNGFNKIQVEVFVHEVFFGKEGEEEKEKKKEENNNDNGENNKNVWVGKLSQNHIENENFLIF